MQTLFREISRIVIDNDLLLRLAIEQNKQLAQESLEGVEYTFAGFNPVTGNVEYIMFKKEQIPDGNI